MNSIPLSKRRFLLTTATAAAAVCAWDPLESIAHATAQTRRRLSLNGAWQVSQAGKDESIAATVPGCIHTDLLAAGKIPDPFYRDNEQALQWIGEANWVFKRTFQVPSEVLQHNRVLLRCEGLDTLATLKLNGQEIGRTDNMFRTWEFDVKQALQPGDNHIEVAFDSPLPLMAAGETRRKLYEWIGSHEPKGRAYVRKEPCNFGWDWGPVLITCGIWRDISLETFDLARLSDVLILQDHSVKDRVGLEIRISAEVVQAAQLTAALSIKQSGKTVRSAKVKMENGEGVATVSLSQPKLWWPAGMGTQPLYEVQVELLDPKGKLLDRTSRRIGLRTVKLLEPDNENSLRLEVNGVAFFAKGANYIPADAFANRVTRDTLRRYVADAVAVNMNTLRFWGGGYYEEDALFDACDEMGICVWLDFKFACSSYPAFEDAFMENVRLEARDNLRRLRHHPCIAVWCGNNEIGLMVKEQWSDESMGRADYDKLFKNHLAQQVKELAPQANYVSGSPDCGDTHYWQVWHGGKTFDAYRTFTGFASEFGFQSFPEPRTVHAYTTEADRASLVTPVMEWHQRSPKGNEKIRDMLSQYFHPPKDFDSALWLSQIVQGYGIKIGAEYWRQTMPKSMACVFWQYNDCWPVASWSSVDYYGRWKALHYLAGRFYAPLLVSGLEDPKTSSIAIFVTSDRLEACRGTVSWDVTDVAGSSVARDSMSLELSSRKSQKIKTLDLRDLAQTHGANNLLTWLKLSVEGQVVSENLVFLVPPKELKLLDPQIKSHVAKASNGFQVTLTASRPSLWTWLELEGAEGRYSDNFIHLLPNTPSQILVRPSRSMTKAELGNTLRVRSLFDTF